MPRRVLAAVGGGVLVVIILIVTLVSCTGGSGTNASGDGDATSLGGNRSGGDTKGGSCDLIRGKLVTKAKWTRTKSPGYAVVLTDAYGLPNEIGAQLTAWDGGAPAATLTQQQDKSIVVTTSGRVSSDRIVHAAIFDQDGKLVTTKTRDLSEATPKDWPRNFDLMERPSSGYFHITSSDGLSIPSKASGTEDGQNYALRVLPDAFDKDTVWVLLRGGDKLYKGTLIRYRGDSPPTDPSDCTPLN